MSKGMGSRSCYGEGLASADLRKQGRVLHNLVGERIYYHLDGEKV